MRQNNQNERDFAAPPKPQPADELTGLDALHTLRPIWLPSLVLSLAAGAGIALIAWGRFPGP